MYRPGQTVSFQATENGETSLYVGRIVRIPTLSNRRFWIMVHERSWEVDPKAIIAETPDAAEGRFSLPW